MMNVFRKIMKTVLFLWKLSKKWFGFVCFEGIIVSLSYSFSSICLGKAIDNFSVKSMVVKYIILYIVMELLRGLVSSGIDIWLKEEEKMIKKRFFAWLNEICINLTYEQIESGNIRRLKNRIEEAVQGGRGGILYAAFQIRTSLKSIMSASIAMVTVICIFVADFKEKNIIFNRLTFGCFGVIFILVCVAGIFFRKAACLLFENWQNLPKLLTLCDFYSKDYVGNTEVMKNVKIYNQKSLIMKEIDANLTRPEFYKRKMKINIKYDTINIGLTWLIKGIIYVWIVKGVLNGVLEIGLVVTFSNLLFNFVESSVKTVAEMSKLIGNSRYMEDIYAIEDLGRQNKHIVEKLPIIKEPIYKIVFENVYFKYPNQNEFVLRGVSFEITTGKSIALVGVNGSGKTTIIKLLCRFYKPTRGKIWINDMDINEIPEEEYLKHISAVFQEYRLFPYTIGQNITCSEHIDKQRIDACLNSVGFFGDRNINNEGEEIYIDSQCNTLSGGERQKIALARAIYKNSSVFILDEPASAMDPRAESELYEHFSEMVKDKIAFFVSHRLSSCRLCDELVVIERGVIVQRGSHTQLISEKEGLYFKLWNVQASEYKMCEEGCI